MSTPEIYRYDGENPPVKVGGVSALLPALVPISYQDFMNLTQEEQESGSYIVTNMPTLMNAYSLGYKDGLSAGQKLDQISSDLTEKANFLAGAAPTVIADNTALNYTAPENGFIFVLSTGGTELVQCTCYINGNLIGIAASSLLFPIKKGQTVTANPRLAYFMPGL